MKEEELKKILYYHKLWVESEGIEGKKANLRGAALHGFHLRYVNLKGANLEGANLCNTNLRGANLKGANLEDSNLSEAYLVCADLEGANLVGADLSEANLHNAFLEGAKFTTEIRNVRVLTYCRITKDQLPWLALQPEFSKFYPTLKVFD